MKSFSQFLEESYLNEEEVQGSLMTRSGKAQNFKNPKKVPFTATDPIKQGQRSPLPEPTSKPSASPGQGELPLQGKTTKVKSPARKPGNPWNQFPKKPQKQLGLPKTGPSSQLPGRTLAPAGGTTPKPALPPSGSTARGGALVKTSSSSPAPTPEIKPVTVRDITSKPKALPTGKPPSGSKPSALKTAANVADKAATVTSGVSKLGKLSKLAGPASAALDVGLSTADERAKGSGWARSLAKGATVAAGGLLGGAAGSAAGPIGSVGGAIAGGAAAEKAFDVAAGANARERKAMATANRQRQAGTAIKGIGGPTSFDTKKNTMTTGVGSQKKTVQLAKTGVVQRGGQSVAGHLAYKGGQAVYKAGPSAQSLAKTSSNPLERIGRSLFAGAYKQHDTAKAQQALSKARQSDVTRQKSLGVKFKPGK